LEELIARLQSQLIHRDMPLRQPWSGGTEILHPGQAWITQASNLKSKKERKAIATPALATARARPRAGNLAKNEFRKITLCRLTGKTNGPCKGYVIDPHKVLSMAAIRWEPGSAYADAVLA
jgi:hypothetical protein